MHNLKANIITTNSTFILVFENDELLESIITTQQLIATYPQLYLDKEVNAYIFASTSYSELSNLPKFLETLAKAGLSTNLSEDSIAALERALRALKEKSLIGGCGDPVWTVAANEAPIKTDAPDLPMDSTPNINLKVQNRDDISLLLKIDPSAILLTGYMGKAKFSLKKELYETYTSTQLLKSMHVKSLSIKCATVQQLVIIDIDLPADTSAFQASTVHAVETLRDSNIHTFKVENDLTKGRRCKLAFINDTDKTFCVNSIYKGLLEVNPTFATLWSLPSGVDRIYTHNGIPAAKLSGYLNLLSPFIVEETPKTAQTYESITVKNNILEAVRQAVITVHETEQIPGILRTHIKKSGISFLTDCPFCVKYATDHFLRNPGKGHLPTYINFEVYDDHFRSLHINFKPQTQTCKDDPDHAAYFLDLETKYRENLQGLSAELIVKFNGSASIKPKLVEEETSAAISSPPVDKAPSVTEEEAQPTLSKKAEAIAHTKESISRYLDYSSYHPEYLKNLCLSILPTGAGKTIMGGEIQTRNDDFLSNCNYNDIKGVFIHEEIISNKF
jgi:hypothetical protein